jgi:PAS domain S-box-containing protein
MSGANVTAIPPKDIEKPFASARAPSSDHQPETSQRPWTSDARLWLAAITDSSDDAIVLADLSGHIISWNQAAEAMFGYSTTEIIGHPVTRITPPDRINEQAMILGRLHRNEKIARFETKRQHINGSDIPVSVTVSLIRDDLGRIIGVCEIARAIGERDAREHQLRTANATLERLAQDLARARDEADDSNRAKSRFLTGMSHELRTPLSCILGYTRLLQMEGGLNATQAGRVDAMLEAGKHLLQMIARVLDLSRIEAQGAELQAARIDVQAVAATCLDLLRPAAEAKGLALTISVAPGTQVELVTDAVRLRQILLNLLSNAIKFTAEGAVELALRPVADGSWLRLEISDSGPGIPPEQRHRLFRDFERLDTDATRSVEGAGLGLALSARLGTLMGGRVGHDDRPGGGSVFWLELPFGKTVGVSPVAPSRPGPGVAVPAVLNVLVVDDVMMNRDIAASFLRAAGHRVTCVDGGAKAVAAAADEDFDVVLMDVRMPEMDGLEATRRIRTIEGARGKVPIIALTAQAFTEQVAECRAAGMNSHLPKPFDPDSLIAAVVAAIAAGRAQQENAPDEPQLDQAPTASAADLEWQVVDPVVFDRIAGFLTPDILGSHLRAIAEAASLLLNRLNRSDDLSHHELELAGAAHALAGSAGMFGFIRIAELARRFERAMKGNPAEAPALVESLRAALTATIRAIHDRLPTAV